MRNLRYILYVLRFCYENSVKNLVRDFFSQSQRPNNFLSREKCFIETQSTFNFKANRISRSFASLFHKVMASQTRQKYIKAGTPIKICASNVELHTINFALNTSSFALHTSSFAFRRTNFQHTTSFALYSEWCSHTSRFVYQVLKNI